MASILLGVGVQAEDFQLEEVMVTAQKRSQSVQDVPMSIDVLGGDYIEQTGFTDFEEYARSITNIGFSPSGTSGTIDINMRGIAPLVGVPTVGFYLDDTPMTGNGRAGSVDPRLFDIERIEVLKGPQGHLYGSSAMGGVIKIVTRQPQLNEHEVRVDTSVSSTRYGGTNYEGNIAVNMPLIDDVAALRFVVSKASDSGYVDRKDRLAEGNRTSFTPPFTESDSVNVNLTKDANEDINTLESLAVRASLLVVPNDWLDLTGSISYQDRTYGGFQAVSEELYGLDGTPTVASWHTNEGVSTEYAIYAFKANIDLSFGTITSNTSFLDLDATNSEDVTNFVPLLTGADATPEDVAYFPTLDNATEREEFVQEIRFASNWDFPIDMTSGLYYRDMERLDPQQWVGPAGAGDHFGLPTDTYYVGDWRYNDEELAVFTNLSYVFGDFEAQLGARYYEFDVELLENADGVFNDGPTSNRIQLDESGVSLFASLAYNVNDDVMVYARAAEGFRQGTPDIPPPAALCGEEASENTSESDTVWNYELGTKIQSEDRRWSVNATAFLIDYTDVQQTVLLDCGFGVSSNAGSATSTGVELEVSVEPISELLMTLGLGYVNSELDEDSPSVGGDEGESLLGVPEFTASASIAYTWQTSMDDLSAFTRADYSFIDSTVNDFGEIDAPPVGDLDTDAYSLLNFRIGLTHAEGWETSLFANNLLDERAVVGVVTWGYRKSFINQPRTIGVNFKREF